MPAPWPRDAHSVPELPSKASSHLHALLNSVEAEQPLVGTEKQRYSPSFIQIMNRSINMVATYILTYPRVKNDDWRNSSLDYSVGTYSVNRLLGRFLWNYTYYLNPKTKTMTVSIQLTVAKIFKDYWVHRISAITVYGCQPLHSSKLPIGVNWEEQYMYLLQELLGLLVVAH